jgi:hypothetical protein
MEDCFLTPDPCFAGKKIAPEGNVASEALAYKNKINNGG